MGNVVQMAQDSHMIATLYKISLVAQTLEVAQVGSNNSINLLVLEHNFPLSSTAAPLAAFPTILKLHGRALYSRQDGVSPHVDNDCLQIFINMPTISFTCICL